MLPLQEKQKHKKQKVDSPAADATANAANYSSRQAAADDANDGAADDLETKGQAVIEQADLD